MKRLLVPLFVLCTLTPAQVWAQNETTAQEWLSISGVLGLLSTTTTAQYFLEGFTDRWLDKMFAQVGEYMEHNHVALQSDTTTAGGPSLEDLAALYHLDAQGKRAMLQRVRQHRRPLVAMLNAQRFDRPTVVRFTNLLLGTSY